MLLTQQHNIKQNNKIYKELILLSQKSKNIYNKSLYECRQYYFKTKKLLSYVNLYNIIKNEDCYKQLPRKVSQQTIKNVFQSFKAFINATKQYYKNPKNFLGKPKLPKYKKEFYVVTYTNQAIYKKELKNKIVKLSNTNIKVNTEKTNIQQVRVIPKNNSFIIEIIYKEKENDLELNKKNIISLDLGINNLISITSNKKGFQPILINGRSLKSVNQYYNKIKSKLQSLLPKNIYKSNKINKLSEKRFRKIKHYFHNVSRFLINLCIKENIGTIVIGKNNNWKQNVNLGKVTNQNFVNIPFNILIQQIQYKSVLNSIEVILTEESYTSKCSFLDLEEIKYHDKYLGKRIKRGLFKSKEGKLINADVNGSYNILRKVFPDEFSEGIEELVVSPIFFTLCKI